MDKRVRDFRLTLAAAFVKSITEKSESWQQSWQAPSARPVNGATGAKYRGINRLWLAYVQQQNGWDDPRWCTFKQIKDRQWHLTKGSKHTKVEYWLPYDKEEKKIITWQEYNQREDKSKLGLRAKYYQVFNGCQIEGMPELEKPQMHDISQAELVSQISCSMGVEILHDGGNRAFYRPMEDKVHLPLKEYFTSDYGYNATVLHELSHATGHPSRLNRKQHGVFGSQYYAYEELVAELSSCFMSEHLPTKMDEAHYRSHKAYIQSWADGIEQNPETLVMAVRDAERAADYLEYQAGLITQMEYTRSTEKTMDVEFKNVTRLSKAAVSEETVSVNDKSYVRDYIKAYFDGYDYSRPVIVRGSMLPSLIMEEDFDRGGMADTEEDCRDWINQDPEAAFNTLTYIQDKYPELAGLTAESDPQRFSLIMMEREIYKMVYTADTVDDNWDRDFLLDRWAVREICDAVGIDQPERIREMRVPGIEID